MGLFGIGGSDSSSSQSTTNAPQTASDSALNQAGTKGNNSAVVGPGSLNVAGSGAYYVEAGATNLAGSKGQIGGINLAGAKDITIEQGSSTADASIAALTAALQSSNTTAQTNAQAAAATAQAAAQTQASQVQQSSAPATASVSLWTQFQNWLQTLGVSTWQIAGGVAVVVLLGWLIFHRRKRT